MAIPKLRLDEVFKLSGTPTVTFVEPREFPALLNNLRTPGRGLVIEGPSGIGKTTAINRALDVLGIGPSVLRLSARKEADVAIIAELPTIQSAGVVVIDDFHKLPPELSHRLADFMKTLADEEVHDTKIIFVGINEAGRALVSFARDLVNRLDIVRFGTEADTRVSQVIALGERALNIELNVRDEIVDESRGSFYLAQMLCHEACLLLGILDTADEHVVTEVSFESIRSRVFERLRNTFEPRTRTFAQGPRMRPEGRAPYLHLLYWLAETADWSLSIERALRQHAELRGSVSQIIDKQYVTQMIASDRAIGEVLHFDSQSRLLTVEDPQFVFYLRNLSWPRFAADVGFMSLQFPSKFDIALSFAGSDRDVAEALFHALADREIEVFYDRNEQHRILAEDVEEYLKPIYLSDARFVVCLLGPDYPNRVWTKFESELIRRRFAEGAVIPIWFSNAPPGVFDESRKVGGVEFRREVDSEVQIREIVDIVAAKIRESRFSPE